MAEAVKREFRYERKFLVEQLDAQQVRLLVRRHPAMFFEPYPPRMVNNIYLDTSEMENYQANVSGVGERKKVRLRWYHALFGEIACPMLEFKVKDGQVGAKYSYPFPAFHFDESFSQAYFQDLVRSSELPENVRYYLRSLNVVLCNQYYRWYYVSRGQCFRLTVDTGMLYYQVKKSGNRFRVKSRDPLPGVVELKYNIQLDPQAARIASFFPFSVSRNSKYVTGIERVYF